MKAAFSAQNILKMQLFLYTTADVGCNKTCDLPISKTPKTNENKYFLIYQKNKNTNQIIKVVGVIL